KVKPGNRTTAAHSCETTNLHASGIGLDSAIDVCRTDNKIDCRVKIHLVEPDHPAADKDSTQSRSFEQEIYMVALRVLINLYDVESGAVRKQCRVVRIPSRISTRSCVPYVYLVVRCTGQQGIEITSRARYSEQICIYARLTVCYPERHNQPEVRCKPRGTIV